MGEPASAGVFSDNQVAINAVLCCTGHYFLSIRIIIDVSAADSVMMEQHEYMDKARQYRYVSFQWCSICCRSLLLYCVCMERVCWSETNQSVSHLL